MLAAGVDLAIVGAATALWSYVISAIGGSSARVSAVTIAGSLLVLFGYPITMETLTRGRTVGLMALGLRAVRNDGGVIRFRHALMRGLAFWTVDFAAWTGFCAGIICASVNSESRRLGDLLAGTMVIRTRAPRPPTPIGAVSDALSGWAAQLELSRLPDELITAGRQLVQNYDALLPYPAEQLANNVAYEMASRTAPPPPTGMPPLEFIFVIVAERRRREQGRLTAQQSVPTADQLPTGWR